MTCTIGRWRWPLPTMTDLKKPFTTASVATLPGSSKALVNNRLTGTSPSLVQYTVTGDALMGTENRPHPRIPWR